MTNQQQEKPSPTVSADELKKALDEREQTKQEANKPTVTLADLFDVDHTSSEEVQRFIKNNESFANGLSLSVASFICCITPILALDDTFLQGFGIIAMFALIAFGVCNIVLNSSKTKNNRTFLNNLVLNDKDFEKVNLLYNKAQDNKTKNMIIGVLSICFCFAPVMLMADTFLETPAVIMMFLLIAFGVAMIIKTSSKLGYLKSMLRADEKNHKL